MSASPNELAVFTKYWKETPLEELGRIVKELGFDAVELPVRPGYQVIPDAVEKGLPEAASVLRARGVNIASIAGPADEKTIAACGAAGVGLIRVCVNVEVKRGYMASVDEVRRGYDRLVPALDAHHVAIGVQNHCGICVGSALGLMHLIGGFDPAHVAAVLDVAHCGLVGEPEELAVDIAWSHLKMVNLKNAVWRLATGPEALEARWKTYWTTGRHGLASWSKTMRLLKERGYAGPLCLSAQYDDPASQDRLVRDDVAYVSGIVASLS
jgi:sugar phosphate isomerase/epimerase